MPGVQLLLNQIHGQHQPGGNGQRRGKTKMGGCVEHAATSDSKCKPQAVYKLVRAWPARWAENAASK